MVTGEQMRLLFAEGRHPLAGASPVGAGGPAQPSVCRTDRVAGSSRSWRRCGSGSPTTTPALGLDPRAAVPAETRARIRGELAAEWFQQEHGRDSPRPAGAGVGVGPVVTASTDGGRGVRPDVLAGEVGIHLVGDSRPAGRGAESSRPITPRSRPRCGSWRITRCSPGRVRAGYVRSTSPGWSPASFTHRDSRAGDPDLHTHVAVANKVQTLDGRWLSIDGRVLHAAAVAASETYNTALEHHLTAALGVRFAERPGRDRSKRPVREIVGVDPALNHRWSRRRQVIEVRRAELAAAFARDHGRPPTPGGDAAAGAAGHPGDPRPEARTPHTRRAAHRLARRGRARPSADPTGSKPCCARPWTRR